MKKLLQQLLFSPQYCPVSLKLKGFAALIFLIGGTLSSHGQNYRWVDSVISYSSEYTNTDWSANQVIDTPDVYPVYRDSKHAWASFDPDSNREWIEVQMQGTPARIHAINIYETYNPGAVDTIYAWNDNTNSWVILWSGQADSTLPAASRINHIDVPLTAFNVAALRIAVNSPFVPGWNEIDAINVEDSVIATGLSPIAYDAALAVYPNPTTGIISLTIPEADVNSEAILYSIDGKQLQSWHLQNTTSDMDLPKVSAGLYMLNIHGRNFKLIKQ